MKFLTTLDAQTFLLDIERFDKLDKVDENYRPTADEIEEFLKKRTPLVRKIKDYRKSSAQKANWRANRQNMMKGIKAFHKSTNGKRFHKRLGRFLATRIFRKAESNDDGFKMLMTKQGVLKGINSAKQHLLVELEYFHQLGEQIELEEFLVDYAFPYFRVIENKVITDADLESDELVFLFDITDEKAIIQKLSEMLGKEFAEIEKLWNSIHSELSENELTVDDADYYPAMFEKLKSAVRTK